MAYQLQDVDIEGWAFDTLRNNAEFNAFFNTQFGEDLNYFSSTPVDNEYPESLPCVTTYFTDDSGDISAEYDQMAVLPFTIRVKPDVIPEEVAVNAKQWVSNKKLRSVAIKAINTLIQRAYDLGIGGCQYQYMTHEIAISSIGEATEDIQASVVIAFEKLKTL